MGLMQKGYQTEPCENGMKALQTLEMFKKKRIPLDCAIVDIRLPDIDGLKLLKVIKFNYPQLPVIIITGYGSEVIAEEAKRADAYLEKPFNMDELAKLIEEVEGPATQTPAATGETQLEPAQKSMSVYAMVSIDRSANLLNTYRKFYFHRNVLYCDAIRGDYDLVLLLQGQTMEEIKALLENDIKTTPGVAESVLLTVETPMFGENVINIMGSVDKALGKDKNESQAAGQTARTRVSSYVMLEVEKEKLEAVYPTLYFNDQVVHCDYTQGTFNIVLLMKGTSFSDIENVIRNRFKTLDGVLRIKEYPIITLFEA